MNHAPGFGASFAFLPGLIGVPSKIAFMSTAACVFVANSALIARSTFARTYFGSSLSLTAEVTWLSERARSDFGLSMFSSA